MRACRDLLDTAAGRARLRMNALPAANRSESRANMTREAPPKAIDRRSFVRRTASTALGAVGAVEAVEVLGGVPPRARADQAGRPVRVLVWCEGTARRSVYPRDIDGTLGDFLGRVEGLSVRRARLGDPDAGLADREL